jgi:methionine sulfoxide reductase heme-binding subunit
MTGPDPAELGRWLASRAAGVVALLCITVSVGIGLTMAGRVARRPALARALAAVHQQTALVGLVAIAVHGITLLGDRFLAPSIGDIAIPFTSTYEPLWTGLGVTGGWLGAILGLSYWIRHRIGPGLWRRLHRATILVYVLSVAHAVGAGTDASEPWMRLLLVVTGATIMFLFVMRVLTPPAGPVFRRYRVAEVTPESSTVCSFELVPAKRSSAATRSRARRTAAGCASASSGSRGAR